MSLNGVGVFGVVGVEGILDIPGVNAGDEELEFVRSSLINEGDEEVLVL
tara:strand:- start:179 stop:325 length:147 start_codon:yes stop_codon:yes gene_type:complete